MQEQALQFQNDDIAKLTLIAENVHNGVVLTDTEGRIEWVNKAYVKMTGYTLPELIGKKPGHILQGEHTDKNVAKRISEKIKERKSFQAEILNYTKDNVPFWNRLSISPLHCENGTLNQFIAIQEDITEKKQLEKKLLEEQQISESLINNMPVTFFLFNKHGKLYRWNTHLEEITGYSKQEVARMHPLDFFSEVDKQKISHAIQEVLETGAVSVEANVLTKDEKLEAYLFHASRIEYKGELCVIGNGLSIARMKNYQNALERSSQLHYYISKATNEATYDWDIVNGNTKFGDGFHRLFGYNSDDEILGKAEQLIHPTDYPRAKQRLEELLYQTTDEKWSVEYRYLKKNGDYILVHENSYVLRDSDGKPYRMIGSMKDITEERRREKSLKQKSRILETNAEIVSRFLKSNNWKKVLEESLPVIGESLDADRVYFFEVYTDIVTKQQYASQLLEWTAADIAATIENPQLKNIPVADYEDFMEPLANNQMFKAIINRMPETETRKIMESLDVKSALAYPVMVQNKLYGFLGFDDCTEEHEWDSDEISFISSLASNLSSTIERQQNVQQLEKLNREHRKKTKELEASNEELEQFALVASHDLQEPLRMISGFMNQLERKYGSVLDAKALRYIDFAKKGAEDMKAIILDLLEFSRIQSMEDEIEESVDLNEIMQETLQFYRRTILAKAANITYGKLPEVKGWQVALQLIFKNLIGNALKFSKANSSPVITISCNEDEEYWKFCIADNGIGVGSNFREKIFRIFQREHSKEDYSGTGMGLAICKKAVEQHGGNIYLESEEGVGSRFYFTISKMQK